MTADRLDLPQGTLELLILKTLAPGPRHGWGISERIRQVSREALEVRQGSLYPALHRLERRGWNSRVVGHVRAQPAREVLPSDAQGRRQLDSDVEAWRALTVAVGHVLDAG